VTLALLALGPGCDAGAVDPPPPPPPAEPAGANDGATQPPRIPGFPSFPGVGDEPVPDGTAPSADGQDPAPASGPDVGDDPGEPAAAVAPAPTDPEDPNGPPARRQALAVGQWTRHRVTEASGRTSDMEYRGVGAEDGAHWVAVAMGPMKLKMLLALGGGDVDLRAVEMRGQRLEGPALDGVRQMLGTGLTQALGGGDWSGQPRETVTVPAGTFEAYKGRQSVRAGPLDTAGVAWHHPDVPLSGLVRARNDDGGTVELIAFGD